MSVTGTLTTGTLGTTYAVVIRDGDRVVSMSSADPWYRYLRALSDLFIAGEIDTDELSERLRHDHPENYTCPAAQHVLRSIYLALDEPACIHGGNISGPPIVCDCPDPDRRARLRELIGA